MKQASHQSNKHTLSRSYSVSIMTTFVIADFLCNSCSQNTKKHELQLIIPQYKLWKPICLNPNLVAPMKVLCILKQQICCDSLAVYRYIEQREVCQHSESTSSCRSNFATDLTSLSLQTVCSQDILFAHNSDFTVLLKHSYIMYAFALRTTEQTQQLTL